MSDTVAAEGVNPLNDDYPLYRAIHYAQWIAKGTGKPKPRVFMRRPPSKDGIARDVDGLSVALANGRDEHTTCVEEAAEFLECHAFCRIYSGEVRKEGFDVVADKPNHANIVGLLDVPPADISTEEGKKARDEAENIGGELAKRAVVVWTKPQQH